MTFSLKATLTLADLTIPPSSTMGTSEWTCWHWLGGGFIRKNERDTTVRMRVFIDYLLMHRLTLGLPVILSATFVFPALDHRSGCCRSTDPRKVAFHLHLFRPIEGYICDSP